MTLTMSSNKKVKNATPLEYNNIKFKSLLEVLVYKTLLSAGFKPKYEEKKFTLFEGFKPKIPFYTKNSKGEFKKDSTKIRDITYTPDFTFSYKGYFIIVEAKGKANDTYPIKRKLFRREVEKHYTNVIFFEVYSKKNVLDAIEIIKKL